MKYILALCVFILAFSFGVPTLATDESVQNAADAHDGHGMKTSKDWTHKRLEQVAAILPEKQKNPAQTERPTTVKLKSPQFLSSVSGQNAKLEWSDAVGANYYHVQVSKEPGFNNRLMYVADEKWVQGTSFEVANLEADTQYFWRVASVKNENDSMFTKSLFTASAFVTQAVTK